MRFLSHYNFLPFVPQPSKEDLIMAMTRNEMDRKIDEHFGFEAQDDVEGVLATLSPNAEHDIVGWPSGPTHGRAGARPFYETMFADLAESKVESLRRLYGDNFLIDESLGGGKRQASPSVWMAKAPTRIPPPARHRIR